MERTPIHIIKNLRICIGCHVVTKLLSAIYDREITVGDTSAFIISKMDHVLAMTFGDMLRILCEIKRRI
ncbi:hypothetical protein TSUD_254360 [Trifolium subterraneum]|uniref:DYW domain-containing protein n=1 Tax=Trifolium subterraneum TaxID=3900 RepID=A0A2Z6PH14_TRISU|nr:hypothetical protein TSUD_254360 [Trifolium subterraneum]